MISDLEIFRAANQLIQRYGEDAELEATMRLDAMLDAGDLDGKLVWKRILAAIDELRRDKPGLGEAIQ